MANASRHVARRRRRNGCVGARWNASAPFIVDIKGHGPAARGELFALLAFEPLVDNRAGGGQGNAVQINNISINQADSNSSRLVKRMA
jgi:hypothetical protein